MEQVPTEKCDVRPGKCVGMSDGLHRLLRSRWGNIESAPVLLCSKTQKDKHFALSSVEWNACIRVQQHNQDVFKDVACSV